MGCFGYLVCIVGGNQVKSGGGKGRGEQSCDLRKKALMQRLGTSYRPKRDCPRLIGRKVGHRNSFGNDSR